MNILKPNIIENKLIPDRLEITLLSCQANEDIAEGYLFEDQNSIELDLYNLEITKCKFLNCKITDSNFEKIFS